MEQEPRTPQHTEHKLRNLLLVVSGLIISGVLGVEFLPTIIQFLNSVEEKVAYHGTRRQIVSKDENKPKKHTS